MKLRRRVANTGWSCGINLNPHPLAFPASRIFYQDLSWTSWREDVFYWPLAMLPATMSASLRLINYCITNHVSCISIDYLFVLQVNLNNLFTICTGDRIWCTGSSSYAWHVQAHHDLADYSIFLNVSHTRNYSYYCVVGLLQKFKLTYTNIQIQNNRTTKFRYITYNLLFHAGIETATITAAVDYSTTLPTAPSLLSMELKSHVRGESW